jgi:hypothetical protein
LKIDMVIWGHRSIAKNDVTLHSVILVSMAMPPLRKEDKMILTVLHKSNVYHRCWECVDELGNYTKVDLVTDADGKFTEEDIKEGDKFVVERLHPYITIAVRPEMIKKQNPNMLCPEEDCVYPDCPDGDPSHCPYGLEQLQCKAELRADLVRDKAEGL